MRIKSFVQLATCVAALSSQAVAYAQAPAPPPPPEQRFWHREELSGDWGGLRTEWKTKGFQVDASLTQFYQGVTSGGREESSEYNGKAETEFNFDLDKLLGLNHWLAEIKTDTRFGGPALAGTGGINIVNTAAIIPTAEGTQFSITGFNFTKLIPIDLKTGTLALISFGRFNFVDLLDEHFFAGRGTERFMNVAQIGPLTILRELPLVTNALQLAYVRKGEARFTFALADPNDHSVDPGLSDLFADGVSFLPGVHFPVQWFGRSTKHSITFAITTKEYTPFDVIRQIIIPGPPLNPVEPEAGSWSASYAFRHFLVERGKDDGWGLFAQVAFANKSTSPVTTFFDFGLGGNGLFSSRNGDEFGIAFAYTDMSDELKDNLDLIPLGGRVQAEHQLEAFYNWHIAPWFQLTGDLQIIRPVLPSVETAVVPGVRLRVVF